MKVNLEFKALFCLIVIIIGLCLLIAEQKETNSRLEKIQTHLEIISKKG